MSDKDSFLSKLDSVVPAPLAQFDAFPKLPSTYKSRSESRGFFTIFVCFLALLLMLNDIGEYIWGWPDYEFSVDNDKSSYMNVNVDLTVNMPCRYLSVDLRDAVGDRLFLSGGLRRDGTVFDVGQATALKEHSTMLSARQAIAQSRSSRGLFSTIFRRSVSDYRPTYNHEPDGSACRVYGTLEVKKVTANLHITTLGHGYASYEHVDHNKMNLSHVITEFSFGPYFPDITQPLDYSFETTKAPFIAYQYFLHVVPTTYIAPRSSPLHTNQYSVTHYSRVLDHNKGTPGIFFKFDLEPLSLTIHQRTTNFIKLFIRCVGVLGGLFVCTSYFLRISSRAIEVVTGGDTSGYVAPPPSGTSTSARRKWVGGELRARPKSGRLVQQGSRWVMEGGDNGIPYSAGLSSPYSGGGAPGSAYGGGASAYGGGESPYPGSPYGGGGSVYGGTPVTGTFPFPGAGAANGGRATPPVGGPYLSPGRQAGEAGRSVSMPGLGAVPGTPGTPGFGVGLGLGIGSSLSEGGGGHGGAGGSEGGYVIVDPSLGANGGVLVGPPPGRKVAPGGVKKDD